MGAILSSVVSALVSFVLVGGGVAFFAVLFGFSIGMAILYVFVRFILVGAFKISVGYLFILFILIGLQNNLFILSVGGLGGLFCIGIALGAIEMMLSVIF